MTEHEMFQMMIDRIELQAGAIRSLEDRIDASEEKANESPSIPVADLLACEGNLKIALIRLLKRETGMGLKETKEMLENSPLWRLLAAERAKVLIHHC